MYQKGFGKNWSLKKMSRTRSMEERHERIGINRDLPLPKFPKSHCFVLQMPRHFTSEIWHVPKASKENLFPKICVDTKKYGRASRTNRDQSRPPSPNLQKSHFFVLQFPRQFTTYNSHVTKGLWRKIDPFKRSIYKEVSKTLMNRDCWSTPTSKFQ